MTIKTMRIEPDRLTVCPSCKTEFYTRNYGKIIRELTARNKELADTIDDISDCMDAYHIPHEDNVNGVTVRHGVLDRLEMFALAVAHERKQEKEYLSHLQDIYLDVADFINKLMRLVSEKEVFTREEILSLDVTNLSDLFKEH